MRKVIKHYLVVKISICIIIAGYASVLAPYLPKIKEDAKKLEVSKREKKRIAVNFVSFYEPILILQERRKNLDHGRNRLNAVSADFKKKKGNLK